ncbi:MAG TPA: heparinase II/III family protein [Gemmatimonadales bacterium]|nr:heparinase II/III family protein [Gemmatimonadales bacterium]
MVTHEGLTARRDAIAAAPDLTALARHLATRNARVIEQLPPWPEVKALLSVDGGRCPDDGTTLVFDPWSPNEHACPSCGRRVSGERHHRAWAKLQHLWLAERSVELAALAALSDAPRGSAERSAEILRTYGERYLRYPNRDNVLGPSRLFFSTYLESIWILNYIGAAALLREAGALDAATTRAVHDVADEAANLIGEYDEGFSNRQTWNNAALCAIAVWFEDADLAQRAIQSESGLVAHLRGYRDDGMWYEGENYHLFALRGMLLGAGWAAHAGMDFSAEPELAAALTRALRAPTLSALPDFTFPARKDARFGVSLAQPMYLELWEVGLGRLGSGERGAGDVARELNGWLTALYSSGPGPIEQFDSYLHDAPIGPLPAPRSRRQLSWWSLLEMAPELPLTEQPWTAPSVFMPGQGLGVLRTGTRYVSLECGAVGGGHGHPDRLNLALFADGVNWLADFGTGSYVTRDLFWYRSTLAHNAPRLDGRSQPPGDAQAEGFDERSGWGWVRGRFGSLTRTTVSGAVYVLDVVELAGREDRVVEVPWHFAGRGDVPNCQWETGELEDEFVTRVERLRELPDPLRIELTADGRSLTAHFVFQGELLRAEAPGRPNGPRETFYLLRGRGRNLRFVTVIEFASPGTSVRAVRARGDLVEIDTPSGTDRHRYTGKEWEIIGSAGRVTLASRAITPARFDPLLNLEPPARAMGSAWRVDTPPSLDGTLDGFDPNDPLRLELEDQYRRSEEAYVGPDDFSALCYANWDDEALYLGIDVVKPDRCFRPGGAPKLLDNEPDDIHSDGVQVYLSTHGSGEDEWIGFLVVPDQEGRRLRVRTVSDGAGDPGAVRGAWRETDAGYRLTLAIVWPGGFVRHAGGRIGFDLLVNEMLPGRERRAGQLVWSGGNGWVWLQGDRQDPRRFGVLELVG